MAHENMSIGEYLKKSRLARRLDIEEISQELHIRRDYLEGLEADQWDKLPGEVYAIGFLRNYARFLDVDADALVDYRRRLVAQQSQSLPNSQPASAPDSRITRRRRTNARPTAAPRPSNRRQNSDGPAGGGRVVFGAGLVLVALFVAGIVLLHNHPNTVGLSKSTPPASNIGKVASPSTKKSHPKRTASTPPSASTIALKTNNAAAGDLIYGVSGPVDVKLAFTGTCWVEIWKNGVAQNMSTGGTTFTAGQTLTLSASSSVEVWVGTRTFNLSVDGQPVSLPDPQQKVFHITFQHV